METRSWRVLLCCILAFVVCVGITAPISNAATNKYPARTVEIYQPFSPGGPVDTMNRLIATKLSTYLDGTVVPQSKAGAGGALLASYLYNSRPDGYTLGNISALHIGVPILKGTVKYKLDAFHIIGQLVVFPSAIYVSADSPFKTFDDLVKYARKTPVKWGHPGFAATITQRLFNLFKVLDMKVDPVAYRGDSEQVPAVLGKHVQVGCGSPGSVKGLVQAGKLRILFIFENPTDFGLPSDTANTKSVFRGSSYVDIEPSQLLLVRSGTPPEIIKILEGAYAKLMKDEEYQKLVASLNLALGYLDGKTFTEKLPAMMRVLEEIMRSSGQLK
jgi:tripartite-type tricarboxylate transporter receptor subunit TctC